MEIYIPPLENSDFSLREWEQMTKWSRECINNNKKVAFSDAMPDASIILGSEFNATVDFSDDGVSESGESDFASSTAEEEVIYVPGRERSVSVSSEATTVLLTSDDSDTDGSR